MASTVDNRVSNDHLVDFAHTKKPQDSCGSSQHGLPTSHETESTNIPKEDSSSSTTESLTPAKFLAIPPDGGWGWVIVFASFIICGLVDGLAAMFGVFQTEFLTAFGASRGKTALAGSLMAGTFMISGPVVSGLVNNYGCRVVTIIGSFIAALAYVLATVSPSIEVLILTYGVLAGIGVGMFYLPAMVMVSFYFERRRALATGIVCSGAGFGVVVLAPVSSALLSVLSWQQSLYVISAITLLAAFMGILMRPLKSPEITPETSDSGSVAEPLMEKLPLDQCENDVNNDLNNMEVSVPDVRTHAGPADRLMQENVKNLKNNQNTPTQSNTLTKSTSQQIPSPSQLWSNQNESSNDNIKKLPHVTDDSTRRTRYFSTPAVYDDKANEDTKYTEYKNPQHRHRHASKSCHDLASHHHQKHIVKEKLIEELNRPLNRMDIFYSSSVLTLPNFRRNDDDLVSVLEKITVIPEESLDEQQSHCCKCVPRPTKNALKQMLDCSILTDPSFLVICLASAFIQVAYFIPVVFITEYADSLNAGISLSQAATLVSIIGGSIGVGRAFHGALANHPKVSVLHLNNWTLIIAGISVILCPVLTYNYATLIAFSVIFGFFVAGFAPLANLLLVEYLGIAKLSNAFGLLSMVRGLATCAGPPIAGVLLESTKSFAIMFYFAGSLFVIAGLIHYFLPLATRCKNKRSTTSLQGEETAYVNDQCQGS